MPGRLAYALITPYTLLKSRTGGIIGRLLFLTDMEFVGARLYRPSDAFVDRYIETVKKPASKGISKTSSSNISTTISAWTTALVSPTAQCSSS